MSLLVKLIEAKKAFSIIELGCGVPVAHSLMLQRGSSKVLTMACCPYGRDYQSEMTGLDLGAVRSVSVEMEQELLKNLYDDSHGEDFHIAYSMQSGSTARVSHGYIGICCGEYSAIYHVTLGQEMSKDIAGKCMVSIVEDIIEYHILSGNMSTVGKDGKTSFIDGAWSCHDLNKESVTFDPSIMPHNFGTFCWAAGQWHRVVDILRQLEGGMCLIKGSFNPLHDGHKQLMGAAMDFTNIPLMCMTSHTLDNKNTALHELVERAQKMPGAICVIDSHNVYMRELIADLKQWDNGPKRTIHLFMGIDVFSKFDVNDVSEEVKIHVYHRVCEVGNISFHDSMYSTLSSTSIREAIKEATIKQLNETDTPIV